MCQQAAVISLTACKKDFSIVHVSVCFAEWQVNDAGLSSGYRHFFCCLQSLQAKTIYREHQGVVEVGLRYFFLMWIIDGVVSSEPVHGSFF
jgi:hypothetical protein